MTMQEQKRLLRRECRARIGQHPPEECARLSAVIRLRLLSWEVWRSARSIALYAPLPGEPDLLSILDPEIRGSKALFFPRVVPGEPELAFYQVASLSQLRQGSFGVQEPDSAGCSALESMQQIDLILVPGLGFDAQCTRLGRGKGYYDRLLSQKTQRTLSLGLFFSWQELDVVPQMAHDLRLDAVLTDKTLISPHLDRSFT